MPRFVPRNAIREISFALARTGEAALIAAFLESILTPSEMREISSRWELVKLLDQGKSQRQIARSLGLSLCKITRGSRELKKKDSAFKRMINTYKGQAPGLRRCPGRRP